MGQSTSRAAGQARKQSEDSLESVQGTPDGPRLDIGQYAAGAVAREQREVTLPGGVTALMRAMTRGDFIALGISEDTDDRRDEAAIMAATVVEPAATVEEWQAALAAMPPGVASVLIMHAMELNGLGVEVGRQLARDFREGP